MSGFGQTTGVYYQSQSWINGRYGEFGDWACESELTKEDNILTLTQTPGRYRTRIALVMGRESCDLATFIAAKQQSSPVYLSDDYLVLAHSSTGFAPGQASLAGSEGYDLSVSWPRLAEVDGYQLNLIKDGVSYPLTVSNSDFVDGVYTVVDGYDPVSETFTPHTGFG